MGVCVTDWFKITEDRQTQQVVIQAGRWAGWRVVGRHECRGCSDQCRWTTRTGRRETFAWSDDDCVRRWTGTAERVVRTPATTQQQLVVEMEFYIPIPPIFIELIYISTLNVKLIPSPMVDTFPYLGSPGDYRRWWVYDEIPYQVKQTAGDWGITAENMENSQHTDFNEDMTNESVSLACSNIRLWKLDSQKEWRNRSWRLWDKSIEKDSAGFVDSKELNWTELSKVLCHTRHRIGHFGGVLNKAGVKEKTAEHRKKQGS